MFDAIGHPVDYLRRVAIGPLKDSRLRPGQWRDLTEAEVAALKKVAGRQGQPLAKPARPARP